ncbi:MAG: hypothetical protein Aurels2KO_26920 [Aureliella sp.]
MSKRPTNRRPNARAAFLRYLRQQLWGDLKSSVLAKFSWLQSLVVRPGRVRVPRKAIEKARSSGQRQLVTPEGLEARKLLAADFYIAAVGNSPEGAFPGGFEIKTDVPPTVTTTLEYAVATTISGLPVATPSDDYPVLSGEVVFSPGQTQALIQVAATDDDMLEPTEYVKIELVDGVDYSVNDTLGLGVDASIAIEDLDAGTLKIEAVDPTASEVDSDPGQFAVYIENSIGLSLGYAEDLTVSLDISGSATNGTDYTTVASSVVLPAGATEALIDIDAIADSDNFENMPNEDVVISITGFSSATFTHPSLTHDATAATVTIEDPDRPSAQLSASTVSLEEGEVISYTVSLDSVAAGGEELLLTLGGDADASDLDPTSTTYPVSFAASETTKVIEVTISDDMLVEDVELLEADLSYVAGAVALGSVTSADATIAASDPATLTIGDASVVEGAMAVVSFTLDKAVGPETVLDVTLTGSNADTAAPGDFNDVTEVTFAAMSSIGVATINVLDDTLVEGEETVEISASFTNSSLIETSDTGSLTIGDVNSGEFSIGAFSAVAEDAGTLTIPVTLDVPAQVDTAVSYSITTPGTAGFASSFDISGPLTGTVDFTAGATEGSILIPIVDDSIVEADEQFVVELTGVDTGTHTLSLTANTTPANATIEQSDSATVNIQTAAATVTEGDMGTSLTNDFRVVLSNPVSVETTVTLSISGTADPVDEYSPTATFPVVIPANTQLVSVPMTLFGDDGVEDDETVIASVTGAIGGAMGLPVVGGVSATMTIEDDDAAELTLESANITASEGSSAVLTLTLSNTVDSVTTIHYTVNEGTATSDDYTVFSGSVTIPADAGPSATVPIAIPIFNDAIIEGDQTFSVDLSLDAGSDPDITLVDSSADVTISANDAAVVNLSRTGPSIITEDATPTELTYTLGLSPNWESDSDIVVVVGTNGSGDAIEGADYTVPTGVSQSITFSKSDTVATEYTFTVTVDDDALVEADETFDVSILSVIPADGAPVSAGIDTDTVTIHDDDESEVTLSAPTLVNESATEALVTVTIEPVEVPVEVTVATAGDASDVTLTPQVASFTAGQTTAVVTIGITDDNIDEANETFSVALTSLSASGPSLVAGSPASATITIEDDDDAEITVTAESATYDEGDTATFIISMTPSDADVVVYYETADGSATDGDDYTGVTGSVTLNSMTATAAIEVTIDTDMDIEPDETFSLSLTSITGGNSPTVVTDEATVTIDDGGEAELTLSDPGTVAENVGTVLYTIGLDARDAGADDATVSYWTADGTAVDGTDYTGVSGNLVFAPSETEKVVTVTISDDNLVESDSDFDFQISLVEDGGVDIGPTSLSVDTGIDDDDTASASISRFFDGAEGVGPGTGITGRFTISLTNPVEEPTTIFYGVDGASTADEGTDFETLVTSVVIPAHSLTANVDVVPLNDTTVEGDESVIVTLSSADAAPIDSGSLTATGGDTLTIVDNDVAVVDVSSGSVTEGDNITFTLTLSKPVVDDVTVPYTLGGSATEGADYSGMAGSVVFTSLGALTQEVVLTGMGDTIVEGDETVELNLGTVTGGSGAASAGTDGTVDIADDDSAVINIAAALTTITESDDAQFIVFLSSLAEQDTTVTVNLSGSADPVDDYDVPATTQVVIPGGSPSTNLVININDMDGLVEGPETLIGTIDSMFTATGDISLGATTSATVTITDDDDAIASIVDAGSLAFSEGVGTATITVELSNESTADTTIGYSLSDGSAVAAGTDVAETDYAAASGSITIPTGETTGLITVAIDPDLIVEGDEFFDLTLTGISNADGAASLGASISPVTIEDDDSALVTIDPASTSILEDGGDVVFTVSLSKASDDSVVIPFAESGTATAGVSDDYTITGGPLTIAAGDKTADITVSVVDNTIVESTESLVISLDGSSLAGEISLGATDQGTLVINDDDQAAVLIPATLVANEATGVASIPISLTTENDVPFNLTYSISFPAASTTAAEAADVAEPLTGTIAVPANTTAIDFPLSLVNDNIVELDETFTFELTGIDAASISLDAGASLTTITIDSEDESVLRVLTPGPSSSSSQNEGDVTATSDLFFLSLSNPVTTPTTVTYSFDSSTADAGTDFNVAAPTSTVVPANVTSFAIPVEILGDELVEADEVISMSLEAASNPDVVLNVTSNTIADATLVNDDGDATLSVETDAMTGTIAEGGQVVFTLSLSAPVGETTTISYDLLSPAGTYDTEGFLDSAAVTSLSLDSQFIDTTAPLGTGTIEIPSGSQEVFITIDAIDDNVVESDEGLTLSVSGIDPAFVLGSGASDSVVIEDNDSTELVIVGDTNGFEEGPVNANFRLILTNPMDTPLEVTVDDMVAGAGFGLATPTDDFVPLGGPTDFTVGAGETTLPIEVTIENDMIAEVPELVQYTAESATPGAAYQPGDFTLVSGSDVAFITIVDNDEASVTINDLSVDETVGTATVTVDFDEIQTDTVLTFTLANNSALVGEDYSGPTTITKAVTAGEVSTTIEIPIIDDSVVEQDEVFQVSLSGYTSDEPFGIAVPAEGSVTIDSEDQATAVILPGSAVEDGQPMVVTISLTSLSDEETQVTLAVSDDTAVSPDDYSPAATIVATVPANSAIGTVTIGTTGGDDTLAPLDDTLIEGAETVSVSITGISGDNAGDITAGADEAFTIVDNDTLDLSISGSPASIDEASGIALVTLSLATAAVSDVTIQLGTGGDADASDYTLSSTEAVIPMGATTAVVSVTADPDADNELDETVVVSIDSVDGFTSLQVPAIGDASTITILDDDTPKVSVEFSADSVEEGDPVDLVVNLDKPATDEFTLFYSTGGDADGTDYTGLDGSVIVPVSATVVTVPVTVTDDVDPEALETLEVQLTSITSGVSLAAVTETPDNATLTIVDNDTPLLTVSKLADAIDPDGDTGAGTNGVFLINLSNTVGTDTTVTFSLSGSASSTDTLDYTVASTTTAIIPAGQNNTFVNIEPVNDGVVEENQDVVITLVSFTGDSDIEIVSTSDNEATLTVMDMDEAEVSISIPQTSVTEGSSFDIVVELDKPTEHGFEIDLSKVISPNSGTGMADTDLADPLVVPGGVTSYTVSVEATADGIVEDAETLTVTADSIVDTLPASDYDGRVTVNSVSMANEDAIVIEDNDTLQIQGAPVINGGAVQRSRVTEIKVVLNGEIEATEIANIHVSNRDTMAAIDIAPTVFDYDSATGLTTISVRFQGVGTDMTPALTSLLDGNYELKLDSSLKDKTGSMLGTDFVFGSLATDGFYRLFGDATGPGAGGNSTVNSADLFLFGAAYSGTYDNAFDSDNNGTLNAADIFAFGDAFGNTRDISGF